MRLWIPLSKKSVQLMRRTSDMEQISKKEKADIGATLSDSGFSNCLTVKQIVHILTETYEKFDREMFEKRCSLFSIPMDKKLKEFSTGMKAKLKVLTATSFDAIALVASAYSYKNLTSEDEPHMAIKTFWSLSLILLPMVLIFSDNSMANLQTVSIIAAFPIAFIILLIVAAFFKDAKKYLSREI